MAPLSIQGQLQSLSDRKRPAARLVAALLVLSCLLVCMLTGWEIWTSRREVLREAEVSTTNMARVLALHTETTMKVADIVLLDMVERAEREGLAAASGERLRTHLEHIARKASELHGLFIYNARGEWTATSLGRVQQGNNSDRDYFKYHQHNTGRSMHIGAPIRSRSSGVWIVPISRRLEHADGSFAGVALVTMRVDFFESAYSKLDVGDRGTILFALDTGTLYYRRPFVEGIIGLDISSGPFMQLYRRTGRVGTAMFTAKVDGVRRLYSYRHLDGFPLIVAAALSAEEIYAPWWSSALQLAGGLAFFIAILLWLGTKLLQQLAIRERLEQQLHLVSSGLAQANAELSSLALTDGLTQLANRRAFDAAVQRELARARREGSPVSLLILDVDHFKRFNDTYGHLAGDACLRRIASAIATQVTRPADLPARYGGEEFVVLLPATSPDGAAMVAERIRRAVTSLHIAHAYSSEGTVSVSIGGATIDAGSVGAGPADLIAAADAALYEAKGEGRNRFRFRPGSVVAGKTQQEALQDQEMHA
ncbi:sensor domain-containing diguanylate cyclase [Massilia niabensis]|uniref:diguanylate cyclase n=1 Tax=Massilia niabensis TaxID=544910 RepID=A0ABW0L897_9BURK